MSATRDRVMSKYPGVIVFDMAGNPDSVANNPSDILVATQLYVVIDKRPLADATITAAQITRRNSAKTIGGVMRQNFHGDVDSFHFPCTEAQMSAAYP